jgi:hypothetical protein
MFFKFIVFFFPNIMFINKLLYAPAVEMVKVRNGWALHVTILCDHLLVVRVMFVPALPASYRVPEVIRL